MTERPEDLTQPIPADATSEQPPVDAAHPPVDAAQPAMDAAQPAVDAPAWTSAAHEGDGTASARPVPVAVVSPAASYGAPASPVAATGVPAKASWRSRVSSGRGLAVAALVVGLGIGAVGGSAATFAATHDDGAGTVADGVGGFDRDGNSDFGPRGGHGGPPPGGQLPGGDERRDGDDDGDGPGQLPGGGGGTDGSTGGSTGGTGTDANGASQAT